MFVLVKHSKPGRAISRSFSLSIRCRKFTRSWFLGRVTPFSYSLEIEPLLNQKFWEIHSWLCLIFNLMVGFLNPINSSHRHCRVRKDRIPSTEGVISRTAEFIVTSLHPAIWKSLLFCLSVIPICYLSLMLFWKCQKLRLSPAPPALMSRLKWRLKLTWCTANGDILDSWILVIVFPMRWQRRGMNPCYSKETISPKLILIEQVFHKFHKFYVSSSLFVRLQSLIVRLSRYHKNKNNRLSSQSEISRHEEQGIKYYS